MPKLYLGIKGTAKKPAELEERGIGGFGGHDGHGTVDHAVKHGPCEALGGDAAADAVEERLELRQAPEEHHDRQYDERHPCADDFTERIALPGQHGGLFALEAPDGGGLPEAEEDYEADDGDDGGQDVRQGRAVVVRAYELRKSEAEAGHEDGGQHFEAPLEAAHGHAQPQRHDHGQEGKLAAHNGADEVGIKAGYLPRHDDRHADGAEGDGRGIGDKAQPGGVQRVEPDAREHGGGDGYGSAEARGAFKERAEGEGDEQRLQAAVIGEPGQRVLDDLEFAGLHGHVVHPHRRDHDPDDGEQPVRHAVSDGAHRGAERHPPQGHGQNKRHSQPHNGGYMAFGAAYRQHVEQHHQRNRRRKRREHHAPRRIIDLCPRHRKNPSLH